MKKFILLFIFFYGFASLAYSQSKEICTNAAAEQVMLGKYNPSLYLPNKILNRPDTIFKGINSRVSSDTLKSDILKMAAFYNRNTASDTISTKHGIGAARRWVYSMFQQYSKANQNRLIPAYFQFTLNICGPTQHRNIIAVLPGIDTTDKSIIIVEGHIDSRCENVCDTTSKAEGVEDNGSGTALVMELARVMSRYSYNNTIVFMVTIGEEQGLYGAQAFANYAKAKGIKIKAVLNNDVIGGIICGYTSSAPSCPGYGDLDSTHVRLFSYGSFNAPCKGLSRFIKLEYKENLLPTATIPMEINIMSPEDRTGRGGDHIPFRQDGYAAMRFTAENEDGDADVTDTAYKDRQHTTRDSLGTHKVNSNVLDSFFVNFPYLARNTVINGNAAGMLGIGPFQPDFNLTATADFNLRIQVTKETQYHQYRIGVRSTSNDWDSVYTMTGTLIDTIKGLAPDVYDVSVMSDDTNGIESLPSTEYAINITGIGNLQTTSMQIELLQNKPNPFDFATYIGVRVDEQLSYGDAYIIVRNQQGQEIKRIPIKLNIGMDEVLFEHGYNARGIYTYSLVIDGKQVASRNMVFAN